MALLQFICEITAGSEDITVGTNFTSGIPVLGIQLVSYSKIIFDNAFSNCI